MSSTRPDFTSTHRTIAGLVTAFTVVLIAFAASAAATQYPVREGTLTVSSGSLTAGSTTTLNGGGFAPGATVSIDVFSNPIHLADVAADGAGRIAATLTMPVSLSPGRHELRATGASPDGGTLVLKAPFDVAGDSGADDSTEPLAATGSELRWIALAGGVLLIAGVAVLVIVKRHDVARRRSRG